MNPTMHENTCSAAAPQMTRRSLFGALATVAPALAWVRFGGLFPSIVLRKENRRAVLSFHLDQPYLDWSGTAMPYDPPPGACSAEAVAQLPEEMLLRCGIYL